METKDEERSLIGPRDGWVNVSMGIRQVDGERRRIVGRLQQVKEDGVDAAQEKKREGGREGQGERVRERSERVEGEGEGRLDRQGGGGARAKLGFPVELFLARR